MVTCATEKLPSCDPRVHPGVDRPAAAPREHARHLLGAVLPALAVLGRSEHQCLVEQALPHRIDGVGEPVEQDRERLHLVQGDLPDALPLAVVTGLVHPVGHAEVGEDVGRRRRREHEREHPGQVARKRDRDQVRHDPRLGVQVPGVHRDRRRFTGRRRQLEPTLDLVEVRQVSIEPLLVVRAELGSQIRRVFHHRIEQRRSTFDPAGVFRHREQQVPQLRRIADREVEVVRPVVRDRVPVPVVVEARLGHAHHQRAELRHRVAVVVVVLGDVLVERGPQRGERVRRMVEVLRTDAVARHRDHEAAHVAVALTRRIGRNLRLGLEARRHARGVGSQRRQQLGRGVAGSGLRRRPEIGVAVLALQSAVTPVPGHAVGPVEQAEDRRQAVDVGVGRPGTEHRLERRQSQRHQGTAGRPAQQRAPADSLGSDEEAHCATPRVRKASWVTIPRSSWRNR